MLLLVAFGNGPGFLSTDKRDASTTHTSRFKPATSSRLQLAHSSSSIRDGLRSTLTDIIPAPAILSQQPEWRSFPSRKSTHRAGRQNQNNILFLPRLRLSSAPVSLYSIPDERTITRSSASFVLRGDSIKLFSIPVFRVSDSSPFLRRPSSVSV